MKPRVIWLDDDIRKEKMKGTVVLFKKPFDLIECETIDEFYNKSEAFEWDAAILDVLDPNEHSSDFSNAIQFLTSNFKGKPWFVFSGQDKITGKDNDIARMLEGRAYQRKYVSKKIYIKAEHEKELREDITTAVTNNRRFAVEDEYSKVLDIASCRLNGPDCRKILLDILCAAGGVERVDSHLYYNPIRVVLEWMFRACRASGLLHDKCFDKNDHINLTDSSLFMAGLAATHSGVQCAKAHFPSLVAKNVKTILEITGGASHTTEVDTRENPNLVAYWQGIDTPYLLYSITYMLCDTLIWFDKYVEANSDIEANKALWQDIPEDELKKNYEGMMSIVEQDECHNYHCGKCLLPFKAEPPVGKLVRLSCVAENTNFKSSEQYPFFAKKFEVITE